MSELGKIRNRTRILWSDLVSEVSECLVELLLASLRPLSPLSPSLGRSMAQREAGFLIEFFWWAGGGGWGRGGVGGFNEARSCFHRDLSASALQVSILWIKRKVWACRSTPEVSALTKLLCSVWHFHLNGIHPRPLHAEPGVPITTWCPLARWTRCSLMAVSAPQLVRGGQTWYLLLATMVKRAIVKSQSRFCKMTTAEF